MPNINKSKLISYRQIEMYTLINDIESYPRFVPFCRDSQINELYRR
ncbi:SRPBCC family protein [Coxiella endosymbiont of Rhipicephalus microplus]